MNVTAHDQRSLRVGLTASKIQLLGTEPREVSSWKNTSEASLTLLAAGPRTWHATLFRAARRGATWSRYRPVTNLQNNGHYMYHQFNIQKFYVLATHCICTDDVAGLWPATSLVHYTTSCNTQSSAPEDGQNNFPKHVELTGIINKPLFLHLVGCLYYLYFIIFF